MKSANSVLKDRKNGWRMCFQAMDNIKVSIIIPVYNVEKYIDRCLKSVIGQTYRNLEIIVVDDGSTDKSGKIVDKYKALDSRVIAVHKKNGGLSSARNAGMKYISGTFTIFVDSDDYLEQNAIEKLIKYMKDDVEIVIFPYIKEYSGKNVRAKIFAESNKTFTNKQVKQELFAMLVGPDDRKKVSPLRIDRLNTAWGKLYRTELINDVRFVDTNLIGVEDGWFNLNVFDNVSGKVIYTEDTWYRYEKENSKSLLHSYKKDYEKKRWSFYKRTQKLLKETDNEHLYKNLNYRIILELLGIVVNANNAGESVRKTAVKLRLINKHYKYEKYFKHVCYNQFEFPWMIFYFMCRHGMYEPILLLLRITGKVRQQ